MSGAAWKLPGRRSKYPEGPVARTAARFYPSGPGGIAPGSTFQMQDKRLCLVGPDGAFRRIETPARARREGA